MKRMKKLVGLLLTMVMVLSMTMTAFAATVKECTITGPSNGHTYNVYQIFKGDFDTESKKLSNIVWGQNGEGYVEDKVTPVNDTILNELAAVSAAAPNQTKLEKILPHVDLNSNPFTTLDDEHVTRTVPTGYYLIKDMTLLNNGDDAYSTYIVEVVENTTINPKVAKPSVDKQIQDQNIDGDKEANSTDGWGETADHKLFENFDFKLVATLEADKDYADYKTYLVKFTDTMSEGITFVGIKSVVVNGKTTEGVNSSVDLTNAYKNVTPDGGKLVIEINDLKTAAPTLDLTKGATVTVIYTAYLNENADITTKGETTTTNTNKVYLEYSNNPNVSGSGEPELGKTPEDTVWAFTYEVDNTKYENEIDEKNVLEGAGFKLLDASGNAVVFIYDETLKAYRPIKTGETGDAEIFSKENGTFNIVGLDVGTYTLTETTTPPGYNTCEDVTITITATHVEENSAGKVDMSASQNMKNDVVNKSGTVLPETGGMGTTLFYVFGTILVAGAAIMLITKKRMNNVR